MLSIKIIIIIKKKCKGEEEIYDDGEGKGNMP